MPSLPDHFWQSHAPLLLIWEGLFGLGYTGLAARDAAFASSKDRQDRVASFLEPPLDFVLWPFDYPAIECPWIIGGISQTYKH
jgi:hypothetical protein